MPRNRMNLWELSNSIRDSQSLTGSNPVDKQMLLVMYGLKIGCCEDCIYQGVLCCNPKDFELVYLCEPCYDNRHNAYLKSLRRLV